MLNIRKVTKEEVVKIQVLNDKIFFKNREFDSDLDHNWAMGPNGTKYFNDTFENDKALFILAEKDSEIIGYLAASPVSAAYSYKLSRYIELENIGVLPEYRKRGVGLKLLKYFEEWSRKQGYEKVILDSYYKNTSAIDFYKKNGFEPINIKLEKKL